MPSDSEPFSVYGYDTSMLDCVRTQRSECRNDPQASDSLFRNRMDVPDRCRLLELPAEIRSEIFNYVLPETMNHGSKGLCWIKGTTALLAVSKQIHDEASYQMYSTATFLLNTVWDCTTFECRCLLPSGLTPIRTYAFPDKLSPRYTQFIQDFKIKIHLCDSYSGMIKFNHGNLKGLFRGLRDQVESFCATLRNLTNLKRIHISFQDGNRYSRKADETILEPFLHLSNPPRFEFSGDVSEETKREFDRLQTREESHSRTPL